MEGIPVCYLVASNIIYSDPVYIYSIKYQTYKILYIYIFYSIGRSREGLLRTWLPLSAKNLGLWLLWYPALTKWYPYHENISVTSTFYFSALFGSVDRWSKKVINCILAECVAFLLNMHFSPLNESGSTSVL